MDLDRFSPIRINRGMFLLKLFESKEGGNFDPKIPFQIKIGSNRI